ncbi:hypothetical protein [Granulicella sibirica]|uniref:Uncharacterized protein n=1 Tax=Granulicella sibirica TaxID=2479048 RepID=A0A4Q0T463_9BACT|nr:hypothetical protein [Granulicella sibirica]RXH58515.1 hypothetical protein GRAN_1825 [Granulicella sibirica]
MLLELGKAGSFVVCILSLYSVLMSGFFEPNTTWEQRLMLGLSRLFVAGCVSFASGLVFSYPVKTNPDAGVSVWRALPVQMFLWAGGLMGTLFLIAWYLRCGGVNSFGFKVDCF